MVPLVTGHDDNLNGSPIIKFRTHNRAEYTEKRGKCCPTNIRRKQLQTYYKHLQTVRKQLQTIRMQLQTPTNTYKLSLQTLRKSLQMPTNTQKQAYKHYKKPTTNLLQICSRFVVPFSIKISLQTNYLLQTLQCNLLLGTTNGTTNFVVESLQTNYKRRRTYYKPTTNANKVCSTFVVGLQCLSGRVMR